MQSVFKDMTYLTSFINDFHFDVLVVYKNKTFVIDKKNPQYVGQYAPTFDCLSNTFLLLMIQQTSFIRL